MEEARNCICCNVQNCAYNDDCRCTAKKVDVGPQYCACTAGCSDETVCATFRPKA
ncbi:DUF1540 domain-containing protein [Yanshouia hominis]|uniref:DUF1540 domain-containing protein n=1 Tax=Yanshouia hominis TaxID=2763673 RepID=A0ABR7NJH6_9FIRM|nr:DUF1540 domain-containing protein [Yanshouia hominis]MBC8576559.1 DUF1540 domain-containing protein [Yanshouia hominis]